MREQNRDLERLQDILRCILEIIERTNQFHRGMKTENPIMYYGFVKEIEIIGEAAWKLSSDFKENHTEIPWEQVSKMRHILVHEYYHIDDEFLEYTIQNDIPEMKSFIEMYINDIAK